MIPSKQQMEVSFKPDTLRDGPLPKMADHIGRHC